MLPGFPKRKLFLDEDTNSSGLPVRAEKLFDHQLKNWPLASDGYKSLAAVKIKQFEFDNFTIEAHFNPGRIISSSAKVDAQSINARPCFLCGDNLPDEQKAVSVLNNYILLVNPFPIFSLHFTIPSITHIPQVIIPGITDMLAISSALGKGYSLFYNGPKCGASAPDHFHLQAGNFGFMKIDTEYTEILKTYGKKVYEESDLVTTTVTGYLRNFISIESNNIDKVKIEFERIYALLKETDSDDEPMMNIICNYDNRWRLIVFPRSKHRPSYFFEEGENKILISPAAVDLGGVLILPREEDFSKITKEIIADIFKQVTLNDNEFSLLSDRLEDR